jgi:hypothetical protein
MPWKVFCYLHRFQVFFSLFRIFKLFLRRFEAARMGYEIQSFMKEKGLNPLKNLMVPLIQVIT